MRKTALFIPPLTFALIIIYFSWQASCGERLIERRRFLMGSDAVIKVSLAAGEDARAFERGIDEAFDEIKRVESAFSVFKETSEISRINRLKANESMRITAEAFRLIEKALEYNRLTEGAFDITVKPLIDLWTAAKTRGSLPPEEEIKKALERTGSKYVMLDAMDSTIRFAKDGMALDLGGIAQGYAAGMAVMALKRSGIQNAIVNVSGDIYCLGRQSPSRKWRVGIQHPRRPKELLLEVDLEDKVIITSGDYEKFFLLGGRRYSHILDPRTGYPVGDETVSATVIAKDPATADALATALCVLGARGIDIIDSLDDVEAVIAVREGGHYATKMSTGFRKRYGKGEKTFR